MIGRIAYALVAGLALGVIIAGGVVYGLSRRATPPAQVRGDMTASFDLSLTMTESFLTRQVNNPPADLPGIKDVKKLNLRDATLRLRPDGTIQVAGKTTVLSLPTSVRVVLLPSVVGGRLRFAVVEGRAGSIGIPATIADDIEEVVNRQIRTSLASTTFQVVAIEPGNGTLLIRLK